MQLIYLAPLAWSSFAQRPHMFVRWFHEKYQCPVLWVNPYPTRFPALSDLKRVTHNPDSCDTEVPEWLEIVSPKSLPIEPLVGSQFINALLWKPLLHRLREFSSCNTTLIGIGKPSALALQCLDSFSDCQQSFYDAMDDYPQFYSGLSRAAFIRRERELVKKVASISVSSTALMEKWAESNNNIQLIRNGLMPDLFLPAECKSIKNEAPIFGYVGTIAQWFDWSWVIRLAELFPAAKIRLVGPCYVSLPENLPHNIQILPACDHESAVAAMKYFDVGLIPFKKNQLTASVDPIKFYEYRALGIPVLSTAFGEMLVHRRQPGVFIADDFDILIKMAQAALLHQDHILSIEQFIMANSWHERFSAIKFAR